MSNLFRWLTTWIRNTEHAFITFISAIIPWLVPIIPAYLTGYHVIMELGLPVWAGWVIGAIIEGLGLASMSRTIAFWENNRKYSKDSNKMPIIVPLGTYIWYLVIVIVVNVLLERASGASIIRIWTVGLLATLSVPTAALISVTSIWTERLMERERQKEERSLEHRRSKDVLENSQNVLEPSRTVLEHPERSRTFTERSDGSENHASRSENQIIELLEHTWEQQNRIPGPTEVCKVLGLDPVKSKGYVSTRTRKWRLENGR